MQDTKYSVILMRDDSRVRKLRVGPVFLRFLIYGLLSVLAAGVAGMYGGWYFWRSNQAVRQENMNLSRQLTEAKVRLERLQNLERLLGADPTEAKPDPGQQAAKSDKPQAAPAVNLGDVLGFTDTRQVKVENVQAKLADDKLKVGFDMSNLQPAGTLSGQVELSLVSIDASLVRLQLAETEAAFQIQRLKRVAATVAVPKSFDKSRYYGLKLVIKSPAGTVIFSETYPLSAILA